jgi:cytosine deaminase
MTLVLRNALLPDGRRVDLTIDNGRFSAVTPAGTAPAGAATAPGVTTRDLGGRLVLPAMAEPHAHIDKALTADSVPNPRGDLAGAIEAWIGASLKGQFTHDDMVARATGALQRLVLSGTTAVRTHVNVGGGIGAAYVHAVKEAVRALDGLIDVQIVALTHQPITGTDGAENRAALIEAIEAGVDLVGGCPHLDPDPRGLIDNAISVATDAGIGIDLHVDETLDSSMLTLPIYARAIQESGFPHSVSAGHCVSLSMQPVEVQRSVAKEVAAAGISIFPLPQTNLFLQGWAHPVAMPRGITPIDVLREEGVLVAAGGDNVQDPFNPVGRSDALETASLLIMAAHQLPHAALDLVTNAPRRALGFAPVNMQVGDPADFVVIDAPSVRGAIADAPRTRRVYRAGIEVACTTEHSSINVVR